MAAKEDFWADWRRNPVGNALALAAMVAYVTIVVVPICGSVLF